MPSVPLYNEDKLDDTNRAKARVKKYLQKSYGHLGTSVKATRQSLESMAKIPSTKLTDLGISTLSLLQEASVYTSQMNEEGQRTINTTFYSKLTALCGRILSNIRVMEKYIKELIPIFNSTDPSTFSGLQELFKTIDENLASVFTNINSMGRRGGLFAGNEDELKRLIRLVADAWGNILGSGRGKSLALWSKASSQYNFGLPVQNVGNMLKVSDMKYLERAGTAEVDPPSEDEEEGDSDEGQNSESDEEGDANSELGEEDYDVEEFSMPSASSRSSRGSRSSISERSWEREGRIMREADRDRRAASMAERLRRQQEGDEGSVSSELSSEYGWGLKCRTGGLSAHPLVYVGRQTHHR